MNRVCANCRWWTRIDQRVGQCRGGPPTAVAVRLGAVQTPAQRTVYIGAGPVLPYNETCRAHDLLEPAMPIDDAPSSPIGGGERVLS